MSGSGAMGFLRSIKGSVVAASVLLAWDAGMTGSFLMSLLFCPIWILVSLVRSDVARPGWRLAVVRVAIPAMTLAIVRANDAFQIRVAESNSRRVVAACEKYHVDNGNFPRTLDELVPKYLEFVPRAKYCLMGRFQYFNGGTPMLVWQVVPPYYRKIYNFETRRWSYLE